MYDAIIKYFNDSALNSNYPIIITENTEKKALANKTIYGIFKTFPGDKGRDISTNVKSEIIPFSIQFLIPEVENTILDEKTRWINNYMNNLHNSEINDEPNDSRYYIVFDGGGSIGNRIQTDYGKAIVYAVSGSIHLTNALYKCDGALFTLNGYVFSGIIGTNGGVHNTIPDGTNEPDLAYKSEVGHTTDTLQITFNIMNTDAHKLLLAAYNSDTTRTDTFVIAEKWKNIADEGATPVYLIDYSRNYLIEDMSKPMAQGAYAVMTVIFKRKD